MGVCVLLCDYTVRKKTAACEWILTIYLFCAQTSLKKFPLHLQSLSPSAVPWSQVTVPSQAQIL